MKTILRYTARTILVLLLLFILVYIAAFFYIKANRKALIADLTKQLIEKIDGDVKIESADISLFASFPRIAVHARNVLITDSLYEKHHHVFFQAKDVFVSINIYRKLRSQSPVRGIKLKDASVFLYTDSTGYSNSYLMHSKKDPSGGPKVTSSNIALKYITLKNVRFILQDENRRKLYDFRLHLVDIDLNDEGDNLLMHADANLKVNHLAFNTRRGSFLKDANFTAVFPLKYGKLTQVLSFKEIGVRIAGLPFTISGNFDLGEKNPGFTLQVKVNNVPYDGIKKLLPARIDSSLSIVSLSKPISAVADLHGPLRGGKPYIIVQFTSTGTDMKTAFMDFENASFSGFYKNEVTPGLPRKDPNSVIRLNHFNAEWHGLPVKSGTIQILNLETPQLTCDLRSNFTLPRLNELIQSESLQFTAGKASVLLTYNGPMKKNNNSNSFLNGSISITDGKANYAARNVELSGLNGNLFFRNSNVELHDMRFQALGNHIVMNGSAKNALTLISSAPNEVVLNYDVYSPDLNLASFTYLLDARQKKVAVQRGNINSLSVRIDELLEKSRIDLALRADKLRYKKFNASGLKADVTMLQDRYILNNVQMNAAGGSMHVRGQLLQAAAGRHQASLQAQMTQVNVQEVFDAFDNFGQDGITSQHLRGLLTADADVSITIDNKGTVLPFTSFGNVNFSLKQGQLINFEPILKIQRFLFKKRDFQTVEFAELKNNFVIRAGEITIPRMEVQSSVLSLFVEGLYSQRGNTDISVQVPLSNLKKRQDDYRPENIGTDKKGGKSVFLRGRPGNDGNVQFKIDLFNKYSKNKND